MRVLLTALFVLCACRTMTPEEYLRAELELLRPGVDVAQEEQAVRRVLGQRRMDVVNEVRGAGFVALGAASLDGKRTALRVITPRGVVLAEDGDLEDLFAPSTVTLQADFGPSVGDYVLIAFTRTASHAERGCVTMVRIAPDARAIRGVLDVSELGSRACVSSIGRVERGRLKVTVAWPDLAALVTPEIHAELAFATTPVGKPPPLVPVAKLVTTGDWLEAERARVEGLPIEGSFSERHALGVERAALALLAGLDMEQQLGTYRSTVGSVLPGSYEAEVRAVTSAHIERGWLDEEPPPPDVEIIEPAPLSAAELAEDAASAADNEDVVIIEPGQRK